MATVLAVDDEPDILEIVKVNLELEGHTVLVARSGAEAIELVRRTVPDLVLLDIMMPGTDGWEVLARLKRDPELHATTVPVVMLTALSAADDRLRGGIEGAVRYLTKPFLPADLCAEVNRVLEGEPEPVRRKQVQRESLAEIARMEKGASQAGVADARPHLTRLERSPEPQAEPPHMRAARERVASLSPKQRELLEALHASASVSQAAADLSVSRSNVYASLRRISRKLGTRSVGELLALVREGDLLG
jgi:two-component system, OmpR family, response regulator VicR